MRKTISLALLLFLALSSASGCVMAQDKFFKHIDQNNNLRLGNDYIVLVVNQQENSQGRFAIETTGGAPLRNNDNNKPLIYGRPSPWTSYTTLWINNKKYIFGGKTERRAGNNGNYGEIITPPTVEGDSIITRSKFGDIIVEQILSIVKSSTTGLPDTGQIKYRIINNSKEEQKIGLRIMLDTMLGENDGAPFRLGTDAVTTDKLYYKKELNNFWQAFDSLAAPQVTSQGTFLGPDVTPPDKVYFADWGSLADGIWDFDFNPGQEFIRKGEYEIDSAIAMFWVPEKIPAGESKTYITKYGLGGITIVPGLISLGVTSPAEVTLDKDNESFPIIAYLENTSEINARNVSVKLELPDTFEAGKITRELGNMKAGESAQLKWDVKPAGSEIPKEITYRVLVEADNTDSNQVERNVKFVGPPVLNAKITLLEDVGIINGQLKPNPFKLQAKLSNSGESSLYGVEAELILPPGLVPGPSEKLKKHLGYLQSQENLKVNWLIEALRIDGELPFAVKVSGINGYEKTIVEKISLPELKPIIYLNVVEEDDSNFISIELRAANIAEAENLSFNFNYNTDKLRLSYISRGNLFVTEGNLLPWNKPKKIKDGLIEFNQELPFSRATGVLATLHFRKKEENIGNIIVNNLKAFDGLGNEIQLDIKNIKQEAK
ncbi:MULTISPECIES: hypothetical protein [unclassified Halanaerobium]|uniref:hypothetical protein n=1 Tax=unclassified Halanaerobium TaxID=2641197 RepID=UPI000DF3B86B|nr:MULTISPECIES: hypothetical protein [unclassified Halanaerobium]RCW51502.1 hypothetical protein DFR78_101155 [Halanaerobium sp. MA284_MarDTE_T2]RCW89290.1 hypothetical protein DER71_101105 [Halanaerobium sp. DL-01]